MTETYRVVRFYREGRRHKVLRRGLTLAEAQQHCNDPETDSKTATSPEAIKRTRALGPWFDGYERED